MANLMELGGMTGASPPLDIADFYREGEEKFVLEWPLHPSLPIPLDFDELDRKTQFFVLFGEWTRREFEGMSALNRGDVEGAAEIFEECLDRAQAIDVSELVARSYEGLMRVAEKRWRAAAATCLVTEGRGGAGTVSPVAATDAFHRRADAIFDFDEGRLPESEAKLTTLIDELGEGGEDANRAELCSALTRPCNGAPLLEPSGGRARGSRCSAATGRGAAAAQRRSALLTVRNIRDRDPALDVRRAEDLGAGTQRARGASETAHGWQTDALESALAFEEESWEQAAAARPGSRAPAGGRGLDRAGRRRYGRRAGEAYLELSQLELAEAELRAAYEVLLRSGSVDRLASSSRVLARLELEKGNHDAAWEHALSALDGVESLIRHFRLLDDQQRFLTDKLPYYDLAFDVGLAREVEPRASSAPGRSPSGRRASISVSSSQTPRSASSRGSTGRASCASAPSRTSSTPWSGEAPAASPTRASTSSHERSRDYSPSLMRENPRWGGLRQPARARPPRRARTARPCVDTPFLLLAQGSTERRQDAPPVPARARQRATPPPHRLDRRRGRPAGRSV